MFKYVEENSCYSWETDEMIISTYDAPDAELENYARIIKEAYTGAIEAIAQYICAEKEFIECYGRYSPKKTMKILKNNMTIPWIFLKKNSIGTIAYCDEDYVIEFEFEGCFTNFKKFQICS